MTEPIFYGFTKDGEECHHYVNGKEMTKKECEKYLFRENREAQGLNNEIV